MILKGLCYTNFGYATSNLEYVRSRPMYVHGPFLFKEYFCFLVLT